MNDKLAEIKISNLEQRIDRLVQELAQGKQGDNVQNAQLQPFVPIPRITGEDQKPFDIETDDDDAKSVVRCIFYWGKDEITIPDFPLNDIPDEGNATLYLTRTVSEGVPVFALTTDEPEEGDESTDYFKIYDFTDGEVFCDYRTTFLSLGGGVESITGDAENSAKIDGDVGITGQSDPANETTSCGIEFETVAAQPAQQGAAAQPAKIVAKLKNRSASEALWGKHTLSYTGSDGQKHSVEVLGNSDGEIPAVAGEKGDPGEDGEDGYSPTVEVSDVTGGHQVTITDKTGPHQFTVPDGEKGDTGATGPQGEKGEKGDIGATGATGPQGEKGETGPQGPQGETGKDGIMSINSLLGDVKIIGGENIEVEVVGEKTIRISFKSGKPPDPVPTPQTDPCDHPGDTPGTGKEGGVSPDYDEPHGGGDGGIPVEGGGVPADGDVHAGEPCPDCSPTGHGVPAESGVPAE